MHIRVLAVGARQPSWVTEAVREYARRLPKNWRFSLHELPTAKREKHAGDGAKAEEGRSILAALGEGERLIALDEGGRQVSSSGLSAWLSDWQSDGRDVGLVIGGPDGLSAECLERADTSWSLSKLTLPHGMVRVLLVEQLYRAWSLQVGHPYHRV